MSGQDRAMASARLSTAIKHLGNAEDRINEAIFYALPEPGFSYDGEKIIVVLAHAVRELTALQKTLKP
jgi:cation transporter-like permease